MFLFIYILGCLISLFCFINWMSNHDHHEFTGRSTNMVDGNLNVLKERIKMVKVKERLERCCKCQHGWNYNVPLNSNHKRNKACNFIELMGLVCGTLGLTCFGGTLFLCLVSLLVHLQVYINISN